ncbi:MAG: DUF4956 domain-containing protein [Deltaproteobacteria bacterium]|nr:DUF4956 domain-containing protein [Deltaproteobacteria bacterium]
MDELVKEMDRFKEATSAFTLTDVAIVLFLSFVLSTATASIYRFTHRGTSYSQSFAQTLVLMGMVTALIMLIIGSNIARAFSLVGALSVIRFRNAVKETRDVGYMFLVMALGMACGTRFYMLGLFACAVMSAVLVLMSKLDLFARKVVERLLRVRIPSGQDLEALLTPIFREHASDSRLVAVDALPDGSQEAVYTVVLKSSVLPEQFIDAIRAVNGNQRVVLVVGQQEVDL